MTNDKYLCWNIDNWGEGEMPSVQDMYMSKREAPDIDAEDSDDSYYASADEYTRESVAEAYAEDFFSDNDYPEETNVAVYNPRTGKVFKYVVTAEQTVTFGANRLKT